MLLSSMAWSGAQEVEVGSGPDGCCSGGGGGGVDISEVEEDDEEQGPEGRQHQAGQGWAGQIGAEKISPNEVDE